MISEALQAHMRYLHTREAPLPLSDSQGNLAALRLRTLGLSYPVIAAVMSEYHGLYCSGATWRRRLLTLGVARDTSRPGRPRRAA